MNFIILSYTHQSKWSWFVANILRSVQFRVRFNFRETENRSLSSLPTTWTRQQCSASRFSSESVSVTILVRNRVRLLTFLRNIKFCLHTGAAIVTFIIDQCRERRHEHRNEEELRDAHERERREAVLEDRGIRQQLNRLGNQ